VFFVLYVMYTLVLLNKLVMIRVSVPMYVNVANFCFCGMSGVLLLFIIVFTFWYGCFYVL
jgi:hypothetical protein